jgi:hypothetical protein
MLEISTIPTREQIERGAYELFVSRGCQHGRDVEDWLEAEAKLWSLLRPTAHWMIEPKSTRSRLGRLGRVN